MTRIFMIHGAYGNPEENWFPWLKKVLENNNCEVVAPTFPTPEGQTLSNWMKVFEPYEKEIDEYTIFVAHSLGPAFVLRVLEKLNKKVRACFFVANFIDSLNNPDFDNINKTFLDKEFDWNRIKTACDKFVIYHSDNDSYVSLAKGKQLADKLETELIIVKGAGHFNEKAGYTKFEMLLEEIKKEI